MSDPICGLIDPFTIGVGDVNHKLRQIGCEIYESAGKRHNGTHGVALKSCPADLDVAASRAGGRYFLHVANLNYGRAVEASLAVDGVMLRAGRTFAIAPENLREYVDQDRADVFVPVEKAISGEPAQELKWRFPAGSVTAVELES